MCDCNKNDYNCSGPKTSSDCVIYQGPDSELLGICSGDPITFTESQIIKQIETILQENQLDLSDVTLDNCDVIKALLGSKDKNLENLLQVLIDYQCTLTSLIKNIQQQLVPPTPYSFATKCVTPATGTTGSASDRILQGVINFVCALSDTVNQIVPSVETIVKDTVGDTLSTLITSLNGAGIKKSGSGADTVYQFISLVPPMAGLPYFGPSSNFDGQGKGLAGTAYEGWYFISGNFGLPDARGRVLEAANTGVPGGALDAAVDPAQPNNAGYGKANGDKFGSYTHTLTIAEIPTQSITFPIPPLSFSIPLVRWGDRPQGGSAETLARQGQPTGGDGVSFINITGSTTATNVTASTNGGSGAHSLVQPTLVITGWIIRLD